MDACYIEANSDYIVAQIVQKLDKDNVSKYKKRYSLLWLQFMYQNLVIQ